MRMDKLTSRFQQSLADAQSLALGRDHQFLEPAHLMLAQDQRALNGLLFARRMATRLQDEEWLTPRAA